MLRTAPANGTSIRHRSARRPAARRRLLLAAALAAAGAPEGEAQANERGLWQVWEAHSSAPDDHDGVLAACAAFRGASPGDLLDLVARGIEGWHQLRAGREELARAAFEQMLAGAAEPAAGSAAPPESPLAAAGSEMARTWLTRLDRAGVEAALREYYVEYIEYPRALGGVLVLEPRPQIRLADRWGEPWSYRRAGFQALSGLDGQRYVLESARLGVESDLTAALARTYGDRLRWRALRRAAAAGTTDAILFEVDPVDAGEETRVPAARGETANRQALVNAGAELGGVRFAYRGAAILVLADRAHWAVLAAPGR